MALNATEIKEVKLKTKLITKRGDTISYDLKSFESKADRSLADVLKKIPGIEVNKDGSICAFNKSETYENCYKQLLFWESNYAYQREVEKWVIDELVYA